MYVRQEIETPYECHVIRRRPIAQ